MPAMFQHQQIQELAAMKALRLHLLAARQLKRGCMKKTLQSEMHHGMWSYAQEQS